MPPLVAVLIIWKRAEPEKANTKVNGTRQNMTENANGKKGNLTNSFGDIQYLTRYI